ncbi:MAG TPA: sugar ABC transporter ATP-binding protein [Byssovorax sp.]|jgi:ABC-type sugar transport system ATPase subunit
MTGRAAAALEVVDVTKRFGAAPVLRGVSFVVGRGEVHALAGENGAGKSTLVKIVCGAYVPDSGALRVRGAPCSFRGPIDARRAGVVAVHQELSLVGALTIAENLALGDARSPLGLVDRVAERRAAQEKLAAVGLEVDPDTRVEELRIGAQQLVEIARGLAADAAVFVLDEPTSALGDAEAERLFSQIDALARAGKGVLFVSHRGADLDRVASHVTVLRDGVVALSARYADVGHAGVVAAMLGAVAASSDGDVDREADRSRARAPALELTDVRVLDSSGRALVDAVTLELAEGEIVGLAGLRGAGASELLAGVFGAAYERRGRVRVAGVELAMGAGPRAALDVGLASVAADRRGDAVLPDASARDNATLAALRALAPHGLLDETRERRAIAALIEPLGLAAVDLDAPMAALSGGTQQKLCLARALLAEPRVLFVDEPTRGVDVGAKATIHAFLRAAAARGLAIVFASTDTHELASLASRVVSFSRGAVVSDADRSTLSIDAIARLAMGDAP